MGIGLLQGRDSPAGTCEPAYKSAHHFSSLFIERFVDSDCHALIGFNLSDPAQRREAFKKKVHTTLCRRYMEWSLDYLAEIAFPEG